jgi:Leucine-rich repeat (LRR) protein
VSEDGGSIDRLLGGAARCPHCDWTRSWRWGPGGGAAENQDWIQGCGVAHIIRHSSQHMLMHQFNHKIMPGGGRGKSYHRAAVNSSSPIPENDTSGTESTLTDELYSKDENDAVFDHTLALRKSAPRGGTWKFSKDNLSVEIPLGPVTLFSDTSVSIHDSRFIVWTFKVEPVSITKSERIRRERYCFGIVPENELGNPGFLLIEDDNPCRMEGGYPMLGKLHTVMILDKKVYFFMDNLGEKKFECFDIPPRMFPCRLGILAFMHQTIEIVNDLHPKELFSVVKSVLAPRNRMSRVASGDSSTAYVKFLACEVPCFSAQSVDLLQQLFRDSSRFSCKSIPKGEIEGIQDSLCVIYKLDGIIIERWQSNSSSGQCQRNLAHGDFFQELVLFPSLQTSQKRFFCESGTAEILVFPKALVLEVFSKFPVFLEKILEHSNTLSCDFSEDLVELCGEIIDGEISVSVDLGQLILRNIEVTDNLTVLSLTKCNIRFLDFALLPKTLKRLCLGFNHLENLDKCNFAALKTHSPNISKLFLHSNRIKHVPSNVLKHLTCLQELGLDSNDIKIFTLGELPLSLSKLWLSNNTISNLDFIALHKSCPHLKLFDLSFNKVKQIEADTWPAGLVHFYVAGNGIVDLHIKKLPRNMEIFDVGGSDVTLGMSMDGRDNGESESRGELQSRPLNNDIDDLDTAAMSSWASLKIFDVAHNRLERIEERNIPPSCIALFAAQNRFKMFKPRLLLCQGLQILDLSNNKGIAEFDTSALPQALRILNLYNNMLTEFNTSNLPPLKTLWLGKNRLSEFVTATLPSTLKILSLTGNELTRLDFKSLPRALDVLNVSNNKLTALSVSDLPKYLQQLEFKNNNIKQFDWNEIADLLPCIMSIKFEKNDFLPDVDEEKVLAMFRCVLLRPKLSLRADEFAVYVPKSCSVADVVGRDKWIHAGLPVPSNEVMRKNKWIFICRYMIAVSRSGGVQPRKQFSVVYVPQDIGSKLDIKRVVNGASMETPRICLDDGNDRDVPNTEILRLHRYELCSRFVMSRQRVCVLTVEVTDDEEEPSYDLSHVLACLHNLYHSMAQVSVIVLLCNSTHPGEQILYHSEEIRSDITRKVTSEIRKLNDLVKSEICVEQKYRDHDSESPSPYLQGEAEFEQFSIQQTISDVETKILKLETDIAKRGRLVNLPGTEDTAAAELFWEDVRCKPEHTYVHKQAEKLWRLSRKLNSMRARMSFVDKGRSNQFNPTSDLLRLSAVLDFFDEEALKSHIKEGVTRAHEVVPVFFETVKEQLELYKLKEVGQKAVGLSRTELSHILKDMLKQNRFSKHRHYFKMSDIPEPELWDAVLYSSSLGCCFVSGNSYFPDFQFVRTYLAEVFKKRFAAEKTDFNTAFTDWFGKVSTSLKSHARKMWLSSDGLGVFTLECAKYVKHWKDVESNAAVLRDSLLFFDDCGVIVPFFHHDEHEDTVEMQWHIARECFSALPENHAAPSQLEVVQAFFVMNVAPTSAMARFWTSFGNLRNKTREADDLLKFTTAPNSICVTRDWSLAGNFSGTVNSQCRIILQDFPGIFEFPQNSDFSEDIRALTYELKKTSDKKNDSTGLARMAARDDDHYSGPGAILLISCSKRDSALFRFCIEGVEKVLKMWYHDYRNKIYVSCCVPHQASAYVNFCLPLSPIFDQNAHKSLLGNGDPNLPAHLLFPRTCSIFFSHVYEGDGTSQFTDMLKEHLEQRFICSVWYDKCSMHDHSEFADEMKKGLLEASSVIICLTPLYLTRPNCLRELKWALDLRDFLKDQHPFRVLVLALHPSVTHAGRQIIKANQCVILPKYQEYGTPSSEEQVVVHKLSEPALKLLDRLDQLNSYPEFIDAMPWRSNYDDWSKDVPELDLTYSDKVPQSVSDFFKISDKNPRYVHDLMNEFCKTFSRELRNPPMANVGYEFVPAKTDEELHATPKTQQVSDQDASIRLDSLFAKFLQKEESHFSKAIFSHKHAYMLTLMGLSCEQLLNLTDNPVCFKDPGVLNRLTGSIDKWLRKGALLVLSRTFSSTVLVAKSSTRHKAVLTYHTLAPSSQLKNRINRGISDPVPVKQSDRQSDASESVAGSRYGAADNKESDYTKQMQLASGRLQSVLTLISDRIEEIVREKKEVIMSCGYLCVRLICSATEIQEGFVIE